MGSNYYIVKVRLQKGRQWRSVGLKYGPGEDVPQMVGHFETLLSAKRTARTVGRERPDIHSIAVFLKGRIVVRIR